MTGYQVRKGDRVEKFYRIICALRHCGDQVDFYLWKGKAIPQSCIVRQGRLAATLRAHRIY
jgi:hypothetical protein